MIPGADAVQPPESDAAPASADTAGLIHLLKSAELAVRSCVEMALAPFGVTPALVLVLFRLRASDGISSADLARAIGVRPQSIVDLIRPLERSGLIRRRRAREHRRILRISLTAAGERLLDRAIPVTRQLESELFSGLTPRQVSHLREGLSRLLARAQEHQLHAPAKRPARAAPSRRKAVRLASNGATRPRVRPSAS
jgi:DNA-binding MarR family transcriptional regulator